MLWSVFSLQQCPADQCQQCCCACVSQSQHSHLTPLMSCPPDNVPANSSVSTTNNTLHYQPAWLYHWVWLASSLSSVLRTPSLFYSPTLNTSSSTCSLAPVYCSNTAHHSLVSILTQSWHTITSSSHRVILVLIDVSGNPRPSTNIWTCFTQLMTWNTD